MKVELSKKIGNFETIEVDHIKNLDDKDHGEILFNLYLIMNRAVEHRNSEFKEHSYSNSFYKEAFENNVITLIERGSKAISSLFWEIFQEHYSPRDMSEETNWIGERIAKKAFDLQDYITKAQKILDELNFNVEAALSFKEFDQSTKDKISQIRDMTYVKLNESLQILKVIYPDTFFEHNKEDSIQKAKQSVETYKSNGITLSVGEPLYKIFNIIAQYASDVDRAAGSAQAYPQKLKKEEIELLNDLLIHLQDYDMYNPTVFSLKIEGLFMAFYYYHLDLEFLNKNMAFEKYMENHERDRKDSIYYKPNEKPNLNNLRKQYQSSYSYSLNRTVHFHKRIFSFIEEFNADFYCNENLTQNKTPVYSQKHGDTDIFSLDDKHLLFYFVNDGQFSKYSLSVLNNDQMEEIKKSPKEVSKTLSEDWDLFSNNPKGILTTSYHSFPSLVSDLNTPNLREVLNIQDDLIFIPG